MGWFRTPDTGELIGDAPLDAIGDAVDRVKHAYREALGRTPTREEWEALLSTVMGTEDPEYRPLPTRIVVAVKLETRVLDEPKG